MPAVNFQNWLDEVGQSLFQRDFPAYRSAILLPLTVATPDATHVVTDETDLHQGFTAWINMMDGLGIDTMIRTARDVEQLDRALIVGRYDTELLRGATRVVPRFSSSMQLREGQDGIWRSFSVTSGFRAASNWPIDRPK
ncbi:hypothetical protein [Marivita sp.]|uniref:hypothetical protein n=1 Tax=Marivita sp. TaxID=2003365 RepID=UPI003F718168